MYPGISYKPLWHGLIFVSEIPINVAVLIHDQHWGYNSAFLLFFRDFEILGGYSGFADFSSLEVLTILKIWGIFRFQRKST